MTTQKRVEQVRQVRQVRGMQDLLPEAHLQQRWVLQKLSTFLTQAGYAQVDTPVVECSDLFEESFAKDLWQKLYAFRLHHRDLCLRPEYTASICRLFLDSYQQQHFPMRFQYAGPIFRYEASSAGQHHQLTQLGIELFGGDQFATDAEILQLACDILHEVHISRYRLELGHIGVASKFIRRLHLDDHAARLLLSLMEQISRSEKGERIAQQRLEALYPPDPGLETSAQTSNIGSSAELQTHYVTSLLDGISISFGSDDVRREIVERFLWKMARNEQRRQILQALEFLRELHAVSGPPPEVFDELRSLLNRYGLGSEPLVELQQLVTMIEQSGVPREQIILNLSLGRSVSYYTGLVFEIHSLENDGFETQVCGGGRYDALLHAMGSEREVNACGFAFDTERLLSLIPQETLPSLPVTQAIVIPLSTQELPYALHVARSLRISGVQTEVDVTNGELEKSLEMARQHQIRLALFVGKDEQRQKSVTVRDLVSGEVQHSNIESLIRQIGAKEGAL